MCGRRIKEAAKATWLRLSYKKKTSQSALLPLLNNIRIQTVDTQTASPSHKTNFATAPLK